MSAHAIGICRANTGPGWLNIEMKYGEWHVLAATAASLTALLQIAIEDLKRAPDTAFTFSDRRFSEIRQACAHEPADLLRPELANVSIGILAPESDADPTLWSLLHRDWEGGLTWGGRESKFRQPQLHEAVAKWLAAADIRSFLPAHFSEQINPQTRPDRPPFARELLVRGDWRLKDIAPRACQPY